MSLMTEARVLQAITRDVSLAHLSESRIQPWLDSVKCLTEYPLSAEVWVFAPDFRRVLVVEHRWRGLVPPGGRLESLETPREAAARELKEETGLRLEFSRRPAFAGLRSYHPLWAATLNLTYWAVGNPGTLLQSELGQPASWIDVRDEWSTYHTNDSRSIREFARLLERRAETLSELKARR